MEQISQNVSTRINQIITDTEKQQSELLDGATARMAAVEKEYKTRLQRHIEELDIFKAQNMTVLQKDFHLRHGMIFDQARKQIDDLYENANRSKMNVLQDNQSAMNARVENITTQHTT